MKLSEIAIAVALLSIALGAESRAAVAQNGAQEPMPTRTELTNQAMEAYYANEMGEALEYMWQAIELYPEDPAAHSNYGSLAYRLAVQYKKQGEPEETWRKLSREAEREFAAVMRLAPNMKQPEAAGALAGRAAFLLGELHWHLYDDAERAQLLFKRSLRYEPGNDEAARSLQQVEQQERERRRILLEE